ncbi:hypothetical protein AB0L40_15015 [Patulibacter sp. NPDC049589]|uniref:hypothetical protein n=1 Tax=Patulibacter sp. NPDC049589 TaxID=3154731 RepID=UPI0034234090
MRTAPVRPLLVLSLTAIAALGAAVPAGAHGGTTIAKGSGRGVSVLVQAEDATTDGGKPAVDLSTTIEGRGTGNGATVTYWIRPAGGKTFRATTTRDEAGIAHTDVPTAGRGAWRDWDVSAILATSTGIRIRVSNAEANPPGPDPAASSVSGSTAAPDATATGSTTTAAPASDAGITDVSGKSDGAPLWSLVSVPLIVIAAVGLILLGRRRAARDAERQD